MYTLSRIRFAGGGGGGGDGEGAWTDFTCDICNEGKPRPTVSINITCVKGRGSPATPGIYIIYITGSQTAVTASLSLLLLTIFACFASLLYSLRIHVYRIITYGLPHSSYGTLHHQPAESTTMMTSASENRISHPHPSNRVRERWCSIDLYRPSKRPRHENYQPQSQKSPCALLFYSTHSTLLQRQTSGYSFYFLKLSSLAFLPHQPPTSPAVKPHLIIQKYTIDIAQKNVAVDEEEGGGGSS